MDAPPKGEDNASLYNVGFELVNQLAKLVEKMRKHQLQGSDDRHAVKEHEESQMAAAGGRNASNKDLGLGDHSHQCPVRLEPSELRLRIKLDTWMSDSGQLFIRPSLLAADPATETVGFGAIASGASAGCTCGSNVCSRSAERSAQPAAAADSGSKVMRGQLGTIQGQLQHLDVAPASGDARQQQQQKQQQQQQQQQQQWLEQDQVSTTGSGGRSVGKGSSKLRGKNNASSQQQLLLQGRRGQLQPATNLGDSECASDQSDDQSQDDKRGDNLMSSPGCCGGGEGISGQRHRLRGRQQQTMTIGVAISPQVRGNIRGRKK